MEKGEEGVMYNTLCGQPVKFIITAKEHNGRKKIRGGDNFNATITPVDLLCDIIQNVVLDVRDCGNGTYSFCYTPAQSGHYTLSVLLENRHVQGSPFTWLVEEWELGLFCLKNSEGELRFLENNRTVQYRLESSKSKIPQPSHTAAAINHSSSSDRGPYVVGYVGFKSGKHLWKVQIHGENLLGFSFGIIPSSCSSDGKMVVIGSKKLMWNIRSKQYRLLSTGEIIEFYLDCDHRTLKMYHPRTRQLLHTWDGVKGEVSPLFHMVNNGDQVSLIIKNVP